MQDQFDVAVIVIGLRDPELAAILLRKYGCDPRIERAGELTIIVSREKARAPAVAITTFMQRLECARIWFEYICIGDAKKALSDYREALARLDGTDRAVA